MPLSFNLVIEVLPTIIHMVFPLVLFLHIYLPIIIYATFYIELADPVSSFPVYMLSVEFELLEPHFMVMSILLIMAFPNAFVWRNGLMVVMMMLLNRSVIGKWSALGLRDINGDLGLSYYNRLGDEGLSDNRLLELNWLKGML